LNDAEYSQPLSTALQIALVNLFAEWGIEPDLAMGHSSGELAAAYASGRLTMAEACKCSYVRGSVTQTQTRDGGMAVVGLKPEEVTPYLVPGVQIACVNSSKNVTISGDRRAVEEVQAAIAAQEPNAFLRALKVDRAYHSCKSAVFLV
jgi:acyl transferase domain-containing protein